MAEIGLAAATLAVKLFDTLFAIIQGAEGGSTNPPFDVDQAKTWLQHMQAILSDSENQVEGGQYRLQHCVKEVEQLAYRIEDAVSDFMLDILHERGSNRNFVKNVPFFPTKFNKASQALTKKMNSIMPDTGWSDKLEKLLEEPRRIENQTSQAPAEGDQIVGFETHERKLFAQLRAEEKSRSTILIAGPGGSGKSTIVNSFYRSVRMDKEDFRCHAWVVPTRVENKSQQDRNDLLLMMLKKIAAQKKKKIDPITLQGEDDIRETLRLLLQEEKFLVVLDNVWCKDYLEFVATALPEGLPGSKVIITSRRSGAISVPLECIYDLSTGLSWEKAKYLFCKKVFREEDWPATLEEWANKILTRCDGLPLAISAVGTLLAKRKSTSPAQWRSIHESLGYEMRQGELSSIRSNLQPSYRDLSSPLKACFLYFSMFPEGYSVSRGRLIRLWVAEGFVPPEETEPEEAADQFLDDLVERNVVVASSREADGRRARRCRVLSLVRLINISRRNNFLTVLEDNFKLSDSIIRRLSVNRLSDKGPKPSVGRNTKHIRTLLVFGHVSFQSELTKILQNSKYLRVLDLQDVANLDKFPEDVFGLALLKYLSLRKTKIETVPESIKKLVYLETLDIRYTRVTYLPREISELESLRHLLVFSGNTKSGGVALSQSNGGALSACIQKLSLIKVGENSKFVTALGKLTGLKKLGLTDLRKKDGRELCNSVQKMKNLSSFDVRSTDMLDLNHMQSPFVAPLYLQRLYLEGLLGSLPQWIPQLTSVTKIGLKWSKLNVSANPLEALQALPHLVELNLVDFYIGEALVFQAQTFQKLLVLSIEQFDMLNLMKVGNKALPKLEKLTLRNCQNLKSLPLGIVDLTLLKEMFLYDMPGEFIAKLDQQSGDRSLVKHIEVIHSHITGSDQSFKDLSPSQ